MKQKFTLFKIISVFFLYTLLALCVIDGLTACGFNGSQRLVTEGETEHRVVVSLEYLEQIKQLCEDSAGPDPKAVADCTLENLDVLNLSVDGSVALACPPGEIPPELQQVCSQIEKP